MRNIIRTSKTGLHPTSNTNFKSSSFCSISSINFRRAFVFSALLHLVSAFSLATAPDVSLFLPKKKPRRIDEAWNVLGLTNVPGMELSTAVLQ